MTSRQRHMTEEAAIIETFFRVPDKEGVEVDFKLNTAQRAVDENLTGRDLIPKARQEGVSTYYLARFAAKCMTTTNLSAAVISHESGATKRLLSRVKFFVENFKGPSPATSSWSANMITFAETGSRFYIGTAGAATPFGRGDTLNLLHCSEYAWWEGDGEEILKGLVDSVPKSGEIGIESTGKGVGNPYHQRVMNSVAGTSYWNTIFLPWQNFDEYSIDLHPDEAQLLMDNLNPEWGEIELRDILTPGQIAWRRMKLADKDYDVRHFRQEYPMFLEECFQTSAGSLFHKVTFVPTNDWKDVGDDLHVLGNHPMQGMTYSIGADPAGGAGDITSDNAAVEIICVDTNEQVGEWGKNNVPPDMFGVKLARIAKLFNYAYVTVESNNHGPITLDYLRKDYPHALIYSSNSVSGGAELDEPELMSLGFRTTSRSKPIMIGRLRKTLAGDIKTSTVGIILEETPGMVIHSSRLNAELSTFIETKTGRLEADKGCHDDLVMAMACANMGVERAALMASEGFSTLEFAQSSDGDYVDPFSLDEILAGVNHGGSFPISDQNAKTPR